MKSKSCIFFQNETEMSFWMGIYQTAMRSESPRAGCDQDLWDEPEDTPASSADKAVQELRKRLSPPVNRYHNSPQPN